MKNKEIEELLNNIKEQLIIDEKLGKEIAQDFHKTILNYEETKLLLSYIEQLKKRNKELYEGFMATQEELTDYATKNEQLENNRDKAIEYIEKHLYKWYDLNGEEYTEPREFEKNTDASILLNILKGDSDE